MLANYVTSPTRLSSGGGGRSAGSSGRAVPSDMPDLVAAVTSLLRVVWLSETVTGKVVFSSASSADDRTLLSSSGLARTRNEGDLDADAVGSNVPNPPTIITSPHPSRRPTRASPKPSTTSTTSSESKPTSKVASASAGADGGADGEGGVGGLGAVGSNVSNPTTPITSPSLRAGRLRALLGGVSGGLAVVAETLGGGAFGGDVAEITTLETTLSNHFLFLLSFFLLCC